MAFETYGLLKSTESLPNDEFSITSASSELGSKKTAEKFFEGLKQRIRDLNEWNRRSSLSAYEAFDEDGKAAGQQVIEEGKFIRITITGTGKSDWVSVERIYEAPDELIITVKPSFDPTESPQKKGEISHFFGAAARNNFCVVREDKTVGVYVIGVNEKLNTDRTSGVIESARNTAVANLGYYLGIQKAIWKNFCESFLKEESDG